MGIARHKVEDYYRRRLVSQNPSMIRNTLRMCRRAEVAGIETRINCHTVRATGITEYLGNGGKLKIAQQMANHESTRTTGCMTAGMISSVWMK